MMNRKKKYLFFLSSGIFLLLFCIMGVLVVLGLLFDNDAPAFHQPSPDPLQVFSAAAKISAESAFLTGKETELPDTRTLVLTENEFNSLCSMILGAASPVSMLPIPNVKQYIEHVKNITISLNNGIFHFTYTHKPAVSTPFGKYLTLYGNFTCGFENGREVLSVRSAKAGKIPVPGKKVEEILNKKLMEKYRGQKQEKIVKAILVSVKTENNTITIVYRPKALRQAIRNQ